MLYLALALTGLALPARCSATLFAENGAGWQALIAIRAHVSCGRPARIPFTARGFRPARGGPC